MPLHLLMISLDGESDELSSHPDHDSAWTALLPYVDERWATLIDAEPPADDNARVKVVSAVGLVLPHRRGSCDDPGSLAPSPLGLVH